MANTTDSCTHSGNENRGQGAGQMVNQTTPHHGGGHNAEDKGGGEMVMNDDKLECKSTDSSNRGSFDLQSWA